MTEKQLSFDLKIKKVADQPTMKYWRIKRKLTPEEEAMRKKAEKNKNGPCWFLSDTALAITKAEQGDK